MQTTPVPAVSELIRKPRQRLGLSQEKLAAKLGIPFQTVNRLDKAHLIKKL